MSELSFSELYRVQPDNLSVRLRRKIQKSRSNFGSFGIHDSVRFYPPVKIQQVSGIGAYSVIHQGVTLEVGVRLGDSVEINDHSTLRRGVKIGSLAMIGEASYFAEGAQVPSNFLERTHNFMRQTRDAVTIGPNVVLPSEFQLGTNAVIPTSNSVGQIGRYGNSRRMVTAYGSPSGPLYGVGCQYGIDAETFTRRIATSEGTQEESALDYAKHWEEIEGLGLRVQAAYDRESNLITELMDMRREAGLSATL